MRPVNVVWHEGSDGDRPRYANLTMLHEMLDGMDCKHHLRAIPPEVTGAVIVIHGGNEFHANPAIAKVINEEIARLRWVVLVVTGDEAAEFPVRDLRHPNMRLWVQNPKPGLTRADRYLICGYPNDCREMLARVGRVDKDLDWFFAGQMSHARRHRMGEAFSGMPNGKLIPTAGFGQGLEHEEYYRYMARARVVPCPSGPATADSYRVAEALEAKAVPLLDACSLDGEKGYWDRVFGPDHPFIVVDDWMEVRQKLPGLLEDWERIQRLTGYWWLAYKLKFRDWLAQDLVRLGAV